MGRRCVFSLIVVLSRIRMMKLFLWMAAGWRFRRRGKGFRVRLGSMLRRFSGRDTKSLRLLWTVSEILHLRPYRCPTSTFNIRRALRIIFAGSRMSPVLFFCWLSVNR